MTTIEIALESDAAELYANSSPDERRKFGVLISLLMRELNTDQLSLAQLMDDISARAQERGLTPEILEQLLDDDE